MRDIFFFVEEQEKTTHSLFKAILLLCLLGDMPLISSSSVIGWGKCVRWGVGTQRWKGPLGREKTFHSGRHHSNCCKWTKANCNIQDSTGATNSATPSVKDSSHQPDDPPSGGRAGFSGRKTRVFGENNIVGRRRSVRVCKVGVFWSDTAATVIGHILHSRTRTSHV